MEALKVAYGEYIKVLEMSKAELMDIEGPFKYFDKPIFPLEKDKISPLLIGILGCVISSFFFLILVISRFELKKTLRSKESQLLDAHNEQNNKTREFTTYENLQKQI